MKETMYTAEEVINILNISRITLYRYIKDKKIVAYKIGRDYRIKQLDLNVFLESKKVK